MGNNQKGSLLVGRLACCSLYNCRMNERMKRIAIIGGGAAGLAAAIAAGDRARELGVPVEVVVYERDDRVGRSILATGNGRCNFSNLELEMGEYRNADFVKRVFESAGDERFVCDFFDGLGLEWRAEPDGRLYPLANKASVVVDVLRAAAADLGVREACECEVVSIEPPREDGKPFTMRMKDGEFQRADAVVLACGGRMAASIEAAGVPFTPMRPVLGPLRVSDEEIPLVRELDNIRVKSSVTLVREQDGKSIAIATEQGELMFRKYGVSGICVFNLSRLVQPGDTLSICFLRDDLHGQAESYLQARIRKLGERFGEGLTYGQVLRGMLLPRVSEALLKSVGLKLEDSCTKRDLDDLASLLTSFSLEVAGIGDADLCQVRRGGFAVEAVSSETMQVHDRPGLFIVGEALDVDGPCGGYNLHWAWTSGCLSGRSAVNNLLGIE